MKTTKKDTNPKKEKKAVPDKKPKLETRLKELEDLVVLMEERINSFNGRLDSTNDIYERIRKRLGL